MVFTLTSKNLEELFELANFKAPDDQMVFLGLRGVSPLDVSGTGFQSSHKLVEKGIDYLHMRCSLIQWRPKDDDFAVFPGSTVPYIDQIKRGIPRGGKGVNRLATCLLTKMDHQDHRYFEGDHGLSSPLGPHRGFRNESKQPVWRTKDDSDYDGDDAIFYQQAYDNIHCSRQTNVSSSWFSSAGCQVVAGAAGSSITTGKETEQGPWKKFVRNAYSLSQSRYTYALFEEGEAMRTAELGAESRAPTVRFGSTGELVEHLQSALINAGFDVGAAGADGILGMGTLRALRAAQLKFFGANGVDLIAGALTAERLGASWPSPGGGSMPTTGQGDGSPNQGDGGVYNDAYEVTFESLTPGGFFSSDPDDTNQKRSIRTNNPGALNISSWQKDFPGYVGETFADNAGNKTSIYRTPEHGIAAWYHLLTNRYRYGENGTLRLATLARRYAGVDDENHAAVRTYLAGWDRFSSNDLDAETRINLGDESETLILAKAMFGHEIGAESPISDEQIRTALQLKRSDQLPS